MGFFKNMQFTLKGHQRLQRKLQQISDISTLSKIERSALGKAGTRLRKAVRQRVPIDDGVLLNAIIKKSRTYRGKPFMFVGPDYAKAPHQHLVEFGTEGRRFPKKARVLVETFGPGNVEVLGTSVGPMPANPFMRPAWDSVKAKLAKNIPADMLKALERLAKQV